MKARKWKFSGVGGRWGWWWCLMSGWRWQCLFLLVVVVVIIYRSRSRCWWWVSFPHDKDCCNFSSSLLLPHTFRNTRYENSVPHSDERVCNAFSLSFPHFTSILSPRQLIPSGPFSALFFLDGDKVHERTLWWLVCVCVWGAVTSKKRSTLPICTLSLDMLWFTAAHSHIIVLSPSSLSIRVFHCHASTHAWEGAHSVMSFGDGGLSLPFSSVLSYSLGNIPPHKTKNTKQKGREKKPQKSDKGWKMQRKLPHNSKPLCSNSNPVLKSHNP